MFSSRDTHGKVSLLFKKAPAVWEFLANSGRERWIEILEKMGEGKGIDVLLNDSTDVPDMSKPAYIGPDGSLKRPMKHAKIIEELQKHPGSIHSICGQIAPDTHLIPAEEAKKEEAESKEGGVETVESTAGGEAAGVIGAAHASSVVREKNQPSHVVIFDRSRRVSVECFISVEDGEAGAAATAEAAKYEMMFESMGMLKGKGKEPGEIMQTLKGLGKIQGEQDAHTATHLMKKMMAKGMGKTEAERDLARIPPQTSRHPPPGDPRSLPPGQQIPGTGGITWCGLNYGLSPELSESLYLEGSAV